MALGSTEPAKIFEYLIESLMWKEDASKVGQFRYGDNIKKHLFDVCKIIDESKIPEKKQADFIKRTLHNNILAELSSLKEYDHQKDSFEWVKQALLDLYKQKESKVSPLVQLLKIKQAPGQSTREYLATVRITCQQILFDKSPAEKEDLMVTAFVNGLHNPNLAKILKELKPQSLTEAYDLIKKERVDTVEDCATINIIKDNKIKCDCAEKVEYLFTKVKELENHMKGRVSFPTNNRTRQQYSSSNLKCYNCNQLGHIARNCRRQPICKNCGKPGHISPNCQSQRRPPVRKISNDQMSLVSEPTSEQIRDSAIPLDDASVDCHPEDSKPVYTLNISRVGKGEKKYPRQIETWSQYINGQGARPRKPYYSPTVISSKCGEKASGKPVIRVAFGRCSRNALIDTGSQSNVVDIEFLKQLKQSNEGVNILKHNGTLKCANGSTIDIVGFALLDLTVGPQTFSVKFTVVRGLSPKLILGMGFMEQARLSVNPGRQCITLWDGNRKCEIVIPFVSPKQLPGNEEAL